MVERVIEERAAGDPAKAEAVRGAHRRADRRLAPRHQAGQRAGGGGEGGAAGARACGASISRSASARTPRSSPRASRCPRSGAARWSACTRRRAGTTPSRRWCWRSTAAAASGARPSATTSTCATSRGARRCCSARPRTTTPRARSGRSSGSSTRASASTTCGRRSSTMTVEGEDGFRLEGRSSMREISRDPADLVAQTIGRHHQYPDGLMLFLGTMFAPVQDRDAAGPGLHPPQRATWSPSPRRGWARSINTVGLATEAPEWTFGTAALMRNLAGPRADLTRKDRPHDAAPQPDRRRMGGGRGRPEHQPVEHRRGGRRVRPRHRRGRRRAPSPRPRPRSRPGRAPARWSATTCCRRPPTRSSPARRSSAGCSRARRARRCAEGIGETVRAAQIFDFFAGEACGWPARRCPRCGPASASR